MIQNFGTEAAEHAKKKKKNHIEHSLFSKKKKKEEKKKEHGTLLFCQKVQRRTFSFIWPYIGGSSGIGGALPVLWICNSASLIDTDKSKR